MEARFDSINSDGLGAGAAIEPIFRLLDPRHGGAADDEWGPQQRAGLRSAFANRQWPQQRLHTAGLAESPECQLCLAVAQAALPRPDEVDRSQIPLGTLAHRCWTCGVTAPLRRRLVPQRLVDQAQELIAAGALDTAQWLRALVPLPVATVPAPPPNETFQWSCRPPDLGFRPSLSCTACRTRSLDHFLKSQCTCFYRSFSR